MERTFFARNLTVSLRILKKKRARISWKGQWVVEGFLEKKRLPEK